MIRITMSVRMALVFAGLGLNLSTLVPAPANAQNQNMEVIHHPKLRQERVHAVRARHQIKSGKIYGSLAPRRCRSITTIRTSVMRSKSTWSMI